MTTLNSHSSASLRCFLVGPGAPTPLVWSSARCARVRPPPTNPRAQAHTMSRSDETRKTAASISRAPDFPAEVEVRNANSLRATRRGGTTLLKIQRLCPSKNSTRSRVTGGVTLRDDDDHVRQNAVRHAQAPAQLPCDVEHDERVGFDVKAVQAVQVRRRDLHEPAG